MMRAFLSQIFWLLGLVALTCLVIIWLGNGEATSGANSYIAGVMDKEARLHATPAPRVIFVGGSNLAMGLDSETLERALGAPVVNMGVNAGFGLRFMLNQVKPALRPGDTVIIAPEYEQFYGHLNGGLTLLEMLTIFPAGWRYLDTPQQYAVVLGELPVLIQGMAATIPRRWQTRTSFSATRASYNAWGDITTHLDQPSPANVAEMSLFTPGEKIFDADTLAGLNAFHSEAQRAGADVLIAYPPLPTIQFEQNRVQIERVHARLQNETRVTLLGAPRDWVYPVAYFFDTVYHLNRQGRQARTAQLLRTLANK